MEGTLMSRGSMIAVRWGTLAVLAIASPSFALVLCQKKSGAVFARASCKPKEVAVAMSGGGLNVVDNAGHVLGTYVGTDNASGWINVVRRESGVAIGFEVSTGGFSISSVEAYSHETVDCSGTRWIIIDPGLVRPAWTNGTSAHYAGTPVERRTIRATEYATDGSCNQGDVPNRPGYCCHAELVVNAWDVGPVTSFDLSQFVAPFRIE